MTYGFIELPFDLTELQKTEEKDSKSTTKLNGKSDLQKATSKMTASQAATYKKKFGSLYDSNGNRTKENEYSADGSLIKTTNF